MNKLLTEQIINHVFSGFSLIQSPFFKKEKSIKSKDYLLNCNLSFEDQNNNQIENKVWGIQLSIENQNLKILIGDCSIESGVIEYAAVISLENAPTYGIYSAYGQNIDSQALIAASVDKKSWLTCNTYLQATFLSAMEYAKDIGFAWNKCKDYDSEFELLQSFIRYHTSFYEDADEGQENGF